LSRLASVPRMSDQSRDRASYRRRAEQSEADADSYPDDRAECLLEASWAWQQAGELQRAVDVLAEWSQWPDPFDAGLARVSIAELRRAMGQHDVAAAELAALRQDRPPVGVCNAAGELHEMVGELEEALRWFDLAVSLLTPEELAALRGPEGWLAEAAAVVRGRQRVREALALPPDAMDLQVPARPSEAELAGWTAARRPARAPEVRMLFWREPELPAAVGRWPVLFDREPADYHHDLERQLRDLPAGTQLVLVPADVEALAAYLQRTGRDVADAGTRQAFLEEQVRAGRAWAWPPGRNDSCWCGSGTKYKRCCLRA
jgi:tetratricopeptide (TPR) repeat protein